MSSIKPVRFKVTCCAWECSPDSDRVSPPLTQPLTVDATSAAQAGKVARQHGWRPASGRGYWWCPKHVAIAARQRASLGKADWAKILGTKVRDLRQANNLTQEDLARLMSDAGFNMHQTTVAKLEKGSRPTSADELGTLATLFNVQPGSLLLREQS